MNAIAKLNARQLVWGFVVSLLLLGGWSTFGSGHAAADALCSDPGDHYVSIIVNSYDASTGAEIGGASVVESRPGTANCSNGSYFVDDSGASGHSPNKATTGSDASVDFSDSCWNVAPYFNQTPPSGDTFDHAVISAAGSFGRDTTSIPLDSSHGTQSDFTTAMAKLWNPAQQNNGTGYNINLYYNVPIKWTLTAGSSVSPGVTTSSAQFTNYVTNTQGSPASYSYQVQKRYNNHADNYNGSYSNATFNGASGSESGVPSSGSGSTAPTISNTYTFPSGANGAKDGDSYCERIAYTNQNGPPPPSGPVWSYGPESCSTFSPPAPENSSCVIESAPTNPTVGSTIKIDVRVSNIGTQAWTGSYAVRQDYPPGDADQAVTSNNFAPGTLSDYDFYDSFGTPGTVTYKYRTIDANGNAFGSNPLCAVTINWVLPPPPFGVNGATCQGITGWASEYLLGVTDDPITVSAYDNAAGPAGPTPAIATTTDSTPYNGGANTNTYNLAIPSTYYDGSPHTFWVFATNPSGEVTGPGSNITYGPDPVAMQPCAPFTTSGSTGLTLLDSNGNATSENPSSYSTSSGLNVSYGPSIPSSFDPPISMTCTVNVSAPIASQNGSQDCSGSFSRTTSTISGPTGAASPPAGNQYCPTLTAQYASGVVQSDGTVFGTNGPDVVSGGCDTVVNRPFYKVYNSSVVAGGAFSSTMPSCVAAGSGNLSGWNNDSGSYPPFNDFGSGTDLGDLALGPVLGFASDQQSDANTAYQTSPSGLSFANLGNTTGSGSYGAGYSPNLGGNFSTNASNCLYEESPPTAAGPGLSSVVNQGHTFTTNNQTANTVVGGTVAIKTSRSTFVSGGANVYIGSNVVYAGDNGSTGVNATWTNSADVPSSTVEVTGGNIYIAPGVTELDGTYIARPDAAGHGGEIYTCGVDVGNVYSAMSSAQLYGNCNKQLTVFGNFTADKVNMMRTFGSLRDETPNEPTSMTAATGPLIWSCGGASCAPNLAGDSCVSINEPSEPPTNAWADNQLCVSGADASRVKLAWTYAATSGVDNPANEPNGNPAALSESYYQSHGFPYCTSWGAVNNSPYNYPQAYTWGDDALCSNVPVHFYAGSSHVAGPNEYCSPVTEPSDTAGNNVWNSSTICVDKTAPGLTLPGVAYSSCSSTTLESVYPCVNDGSGVYDATNSATVYSLNGLPASGDYDLTLNYDNVNSAWPPPPPANGDSPYEYDLQVYVNGVKRVSNWGLPVSGSALSASTDLGALPANASIKIVWDNNGWIDANGVPQANVTPYDPNLEFNSISLASPASPVSHIPTVSGVACSNNGGWLAVTNSCAAEVFYLSPTLYMTQPDDQLPNNGALQYQSITSLPPVL